MTTGLLVPFRRRPTPGALYVMGVVAFALLLLVLTGIGVVDPTAMAIAGVPLGPLGVVAAAVALPAFAAPPSVPVASLVLLGVLVIAVVNVLGATLVAALASGRPLLRRPAR